MGEIFGIPFIYYALALTVLSTALELLTAKTPKATPPTPSALGDFQLPQIAEGTPQIVVFGDVWITDWQVLWYGNLRNTAITKSTGGGKK